MQPPCMPVETMTAGKATLQRSSRAARMKVCVPPPEAPVMPMRAGSTSGRFKRKSSERRLFQVCSPMNSIRSLDFLLNLPEVDIERADAVPGLQSHEALQAQ